MPRTAETLFCVIVLFMEDEKASTWSSPQSIGTNSRLESIAFGDQL